MTAGPPAGDPDGQPPDEEPEGRLHPISATALAVAAGIGMVGGGLLRTVAVRLDGTAPIVTWIQVLALVFVAVFVGALAWDTWRTLHVRRQRLEPHRAVNRLVLARACALVGAVVAGGYVGYAISWLGDPAELADQRVLRSLLAAAGGVAIATSAVVLERACRVPSGDQRP